MKELLTGGARARRLRRRCSQEEDRRSQSGCIAASPIWRGYPRGTGTIPGQVSLVLRRYLVRGPDVLIVLVRIILLRILLLLVGRVFRCQERVFRTGSFFLRQDRPGTQGGSGATADSLAVLKCYSATILRDLRSLITFCFSHLFRVATIRQRVHQQTLAQHEKDAIRVRS